MSIVHVVRRRSISSQLQISLGLLLLCCALLSCSQEKTTPQVYPSLGAPVTAAIEGKSLLISNNSDQIIYHRAFPTEILAVIEWAPCLAPETCPAEQRIAPGEQIRIAAGTIIGDETESITVFWWICLDKLPGASIPSMKMNEIVLPLP